MGWNLEGGVVVEGPLCFGATVISLLYFLCCVCVFRGLVIDRIVSFRSPPLCVPAISL